MNAHATCNHVNTDAANTMCDSFKTPVVAFSGNYVREHMNAVQAKAAVKARMDQRYAEDMAARETAANRAAWYDQN
jgi:hypothetical protein